MPGIYIFGNGKKLMDDGKSCCGSVEAEMTESESLSSFVISPNGEFVPAGSRLEVYDRWPHH